MQLQSRGCSMRLLSSQNSCTVMFGWTKGTLYFLTTVLCLMFHIAFISIADSYVLQYLSQFGDIYQEDYFIKYLKSDIQIVKDLPVELQSLDLEAIGSLVSN